VIEKLKIPGKHHVLERINSLQREIKLLKPLKEEDYNRVMNKFRLEWNYNSNAIEAVNGIVKSVIQEIETKSKSN